MTIDAAAAVRRITLAILVPLVTTPAFADEPEARPNFEVAVLLGYRGGGDFDALTGTENPNIEPDASYGVSLGWLGSEKTKYEVMYDVQASEIQDTGVELDVEHLHLGGAAAFAGDGKHIVYASGGLGATRFRPQSGEDETRFSISFGFGVDMPVTTHVGLRLEARGYLVSMDGDSEIFCGSGAQGGTCLVRAAGDTLFQYALIGAIGFRF